MAHYLEFKEWMMKEWAVYTEHIRQLGDEVGDCWKKFGQNMTRNEQCVLKTSMYQIMVDEKNMTKARR